MRRRDFVVFVLSAAAAACKAGDGPEDPVWGKQPCAHCSMVIGDKRYAAQLISEDGSRASFDDIGCMVSFTHERGVRVLQSWVRDELGERWLSASSARYRRGARTPMDYGFATATTGDLTFDDVRRDVLARGKVTP